MTITQTNREDIMTDFQFKSIVKMAAQIVDKSDNLDEASEALWALVGEEKPPKKGDKQND